jgi:signal transduction histidine kinase
MTDSSGSPVAPAGRRAVGDGAPGSRVPAGHQTGTSLRDALLMVGGLVGVLVLVELAVPSTSPVFAASVLDAISVGTFAVAGLIAWHRRPHNRMGRLLVLTALALLVSGMDDDTVPALRTIGLALQSIPLAMMLHLLLAFPSGRIRGRAARSVVAAAYAVALLQIPQQLSGAGVAAAIWNLQAVLGVGLMVVVFLLAFRRLSAAPAVLRRQLLPFLGYGCLAIVVIAGCVAVLHTDPGQAVAGVATAVEVVAVSLLPVAFLVGTLAGAFGRAGEVEEVAWGISEAATDPGLLDQLMVRALGDPGAQVFWARGGGGRFADSDGRPPATRPGGAGWWPIGSVDRPVGALRYDPALIADDGLVGSVAAPLALAITNQGLVVELRAALRERDEAAQQLRDSRRRIVIAADTERRRIARDLHDGAQQRIVVIGIDAQRITRRAADPPFVRSVAERMSEQLRLLLDELRSLVHGIMPATLEERGLAAGLRALADRMPMPVRLLVPQRLDRLPAEVESTGYFVVAEALANAVKHAAAQQVTASVEIRDGRLLITVADDGRGAERIDMGFGLRSLQDRVAALGGTVNVRSAAGRGTTLEAEFACG